jgi:hypothetical protein
MYGKTSKNMSNILLPSTQKSVVLLHTLLREENLIAQLNVLTMELEKNWSRETLNNIYTLSSSLTDIEEATIKEK